MISKTQHLKYRQVAIIIRGDNGKQLHHERHLQLIRYNIYALLWIIPIYYSEEILETKNVDDTYPKVKPPRAPSSPHSPVTH